MRYTIEVFGQYIFQHVCFKVTTPDRATRTVAHGDEFSRGGIDD